MLNDLNPGTEGKIGHKRDSLASNVRDITDG